MSTNYAKNARAQGWDGYTVDMQNVKTGKATTQRGYRCGDMFCWGDVMGTLVSDEWNNWTHIRTANALFEITDMQYGHSRNCRTDGYSRFEQVSKGGPMSKFRSARERAQYHYFNSNGAYAKHSAMMHTLEQLVDDKLVNSGWLMAHDASYHKEALVKLAMAKRARAWSVDYAVQQINETTQRTYNAMCEVLLGLRGKDGKETGSK